MCVCVCDEVKGMRKEGRKGGRKEGRKEGREEGRKEGRKERRKEGILRCMHRASYCNVYISRPTRYTGSYKVPVMHNSQTYRLIPVATYSSTTSLLMMD